MLRNLVERKKGWGALTLPITFPHVFIFNQPSRSPSHVRTFLRDQCPLPIFTPHKQWAPPGRCIWLPSLLLFLLIGNFCHLPLRKTAVHTVNPLCHLGSTSTLSSYSPPHPWPFPLLLLLFKAELFFRLLSWVLISSASRAHPPLPFSYSSTSMCSPISFLKNECTCPKGQLDVSTWQDFSETQQARRRPCVCIVFLTLSGC